MDDRLKIDGLSKAQVRMLDIMWNLPSREDLVRWQKNLDPVDRQMSIALEQLIVMAVIDESDDGDYALANLVIDAIK